MNTLTKQFWEATLTADETITFIMLFQEMEISKIAKVEAIKKQTDSSVNGLYTVTITTNRTFAIFVEASLKDGLLQHFGWDKKFTKK